MFGWTTTVYPLFAQTSPSPNTAQQVRPASSSKAPKALTAGATVPAASAYTLEDLPYLLGPIALYPDPLLALILPASTFPLQVVQAERWIARNTKAVDRGEFAEVDAMAWDPSVQALTRFPDVIKLLADHLEWSESLGMAFSLQPADVNVAIQMLRAKAESAGNLKSTPEQVVTTREEGGSKIIYIAPANPERIYVPVYDSSVVFESLLPGAIVFGAGVLVGSAWNNRWGRNNRSWNQVWINQPVWHSPPSGWRPPHPGRPGGGASPQRLASGSSRHRSARAPQRSSRTSWHAASRWAKPSGQRTAPTRCATPAASSASSTASSTSSASCAPTTASSTTTASCASQAAASPSPAAVRAKPTGRAVCT